MELRRIPDDARQAFRALLDWPADLIPKFLAAIRNSAPTLILSDFAQKIANETGQSASEVESLLTHLAGLYTFQSASDEAPEATARQLCAALKSSKEFVGVHDQAWEAVEMFFARVLACHNSFGVTAKAGTVMSDHANTFMAARFITDIRPVFGGDPQAKPVAAVVVHNLSVIVRHLNQVDEILISLDSADLQKLKKLIDRAEHKQRSLESIIETTGMQYLEPKE